MLEKMQSKNIVNSKMKIQTETLDMFPIPLVKMNLGKKFKKEFDSLKKEEEHPSDRNMGSTHHFSTNKYILNDPRFINLKNFICEQTTKFIRNKMNVDGECLLTQSWVNWNYPNEHTQQHIHPNSIASGVLYLEATDSNNVIVFHKLYAQTTRNFIDPKPFNPANPDREKKYTDSTMPINLKNGDFIIFPSYLPHSVPPNRSNQKRISLAYNSLTKHKCGSYGRITEIDYKILAENS